MTRAIILLCALFVFACDRPPQEIKFIILAEDVQEWTTKSDSVNLTLVPKKAEELEKLTSENINTEISIYVEDTFVVKPYIREPIIGGRMIFAGEEMRGLVIPHLAKPNQKQ